MNFSKIYALGLRHLYLVSNSFPRILDLIYWPTIQIILWGFISQFFTMYSDYYTNLVVEVIYKSNFMKLLYSLHTQQFIYCFIED